MFGSIGEPPDEALKTVGSRILNASTISNVADCPIYGTLSNMFEDKRVGGMALNLGSLWHEWIEAYYKDNPDADNPSKHAGEVLRVKLDELYAKVDEFKLEKFRKDLESFETFWLHPAGVAYGQSPIGERANVEAKVLASELPFWIVLGAGEDGQWNTPPTMLLGTFDQILDIDEELWVGEWKTIDEKEVLSDWLQHREFTPQHAIYQLGLFMLSNELQQVDAESSRLFMDFPESVDWPTGVGGTFYQFLRRQKFPQRAGKDKTKEERIEEWKNTLFEEFPIPADLVQAVDITLGYIRQTFSVYPAMPDEHYRNPKACRRWGSKCMFADFCLGGVDPGLIDYLQETDNYVRDALKRVNDMMEGDGNTGGMEQGSEDVD